MSHNPLPPGSRVTKKVQLGHLVRDQLTGAEGYVVGITTWLYGCRRLVVQPIETSDGRPVDYIYLDEPQAFVISEGIAESIDQREPRPVATPGGPRDGEANLRRPDVSKERH